MTLRFVTELKILLAVSLILWYNDSLYEQVYSLNVRSKQILKIERVFSNEKI